MVHAGGVKRPRPGNGATGSIPGSTLGADACRRSYYRFEYREREPTRWEAAMVDSELIAEDIAILRETIRANDGENIATSVFARKVEQLISDFYDDIGALTALKLSDILDLFLIKVLYVDRRSRDAESLAYLGRMMERYLQAGELSLGGRHRQFLPYLSDLMEATTHPTGVYQNEFEAYRKYGDNALF